MALGMKVQRQRPTHRLRERRQQAGLSQGELAELAGIKALQTVSKLERGVMQMTDEYLEVFSKALNVPKSDLLIERESVSAGRLMVPHEPGPYNPPAGAVESLQELLGFWGWLTEEEKGSALIMFNAWIRTMIKRRNI